MLQVGLNMQYLTFAKKRKVKTGTKMQKPAPKKKGYVSIKLDF